MASRHGRGGRLRRWGVEVAPQHRGGASARRCKVTPASVATSRGRAKLIEADTVETAAPANRPNRPAGRAGDCPSPPVAAAHRSRPASVPAPRLAISTSDRVSGSPLSPLVRSARSGSLWPRRRHRSGRSSPRPDRRQAGGRACRVATDGHAPIVWRASTDVPQHAPRRSPTSPRAGRPRADRRPLVR